MRKQVSGVLSVVQCTTKRHFSRKNDRIRSPDDLLRPTVLSADGGTGKQTYGNDMDLIGCGKYAPSVSSTRKKHNNFDFRRKKNIKQNELSCDEEYLYGISPVYFALSRGRRHISEALIQEGLIENMTKKKKDPKVIDNILHLCDENQIPLRFLSKHDLNMLSDNKPHQGVVLRSSTLAPIPINSMSPTDEFKCILVLDEVTDPQNLGALIRSFHFLSRNFQHTLQYAANSSVVTEPQEEQLQNVGIVVCQKNSAPLSAAVSKASAGALEVMPIHSTRNIMKFLDRSKENGWHVIGTSSQHGSGHIIPMEKLQVNKPIMLVLGNEGHGIRKNVLNRCETLVSIGSNQAWDSEMSNKEVEFLHHVDSLNVSVCGGIILHHIFNSAFNKDNSN